MTSSEQKAFYKEELESTRDMYIKDLTAMSQEQLAASPGGKARSAFDMTYEVAFVNRRIATRLRGEEPEPWKFEGWMSAPEEYRVKQVAIDDLRASVDEVIAAFDAIPDDEIGKSVDTPSGPTNAVKRAFFVVYHTGYHDAQLNYIQSLNDDGEMHWM